MKGNIDNSFTKLSQLQDVKVVRKSANEIVNNSAVLQDDNELLFPVLANEIWTGYILLLTSGNNTADLKVNLTGPAGSTIRWTGIYVDVAGATRKTSDLDGDIQAYGQDNYLNVLINFTIINGAVAGNLTLQWAQNTADLSDTTVLANSHIYAHRLN